MAKKVADVKEEEQNPIDQKIDELKKLHPEDDLFMVDFYYAPVIFKALDRELYSKVRKGLEGVSDQAQIEETVCDALMDEIFKVSGFSAVMSPVKL